MFEVKWLSIGATFFALLILAATVLPRPVAAAGTTPNRAPVANFVTDKLTYQIGEHVEYKDLSSDDEPFFLWHNWYGKQDAFFEPGVYSITLKVTDRHGAFSTKTVRIRVTKAIKYSQAEYERLFASPGSIHVTSQHILGESPEVAQNRLQDESLLLLSNSPEKVPRSGTLLKEYWSEKARLMIHHTNETGESTQLFTYISNPSDLIVEFSVRNRSIERTSSSAASAGKMVAQKYLETLARPTLDEKILIPPGATVLVATLSYILIPDQTFISGYADLDVNGPIQFAIVTSEQPEPSIEQLASLPAPKRLDRHDRGQFAEANRTIEVFETLGNTMKKLTLGDGFVDPVLFGVDSLSNSFEINKGNFGLKYTIILYNVAPRTLLLFNARGGNYAGAIAVNGKVVPLASGRSILSKDESVILHRTQSQQLERVELTFVPAAASYLPVTLVTLPLPDEVQ